MTRKGQQASAPGPLGSGVFDPWSGSEAQAIEAAGGEWIEAADGAGGWLRLLNPALARWYEAQHIQAVLRPRIEKTSDGLAILEAIAGCAEHGLQVPQWLAQAFVPRVDQVLTYQVRTIDEAFGNPLKAARLEDLREQRFRDAFLWMSTRRFLAENPSRKVDANLWADVATYVNERYPLAKVTGTQVDRAHRRNRQKGLTLRGKAKPRR